MIKIIEQYEWADIIICVSPSYWADIPRQFKEALENRKDEIKHFCSKILNIEN